MAGILVGNSSSNEAVGELGFKGERGYSAYEIAVQHGYIGTEDEWLASKNEKWQDEGGVEVKFFKGDTEDIEDRAIIHGQLLYNTDSGETFLDYETNRINTGSGNVVSISDTEPTNPATKLWINPDEPLNNIGTEVVNSMAGNQTNMAPSVSAVKGYVEEEYSTSEVKTNKVWINGKSIYRKVINIGNLASDTGVINYSHNISNIDTVVHQDGFITDGLEFIPFNSVYRMTGSAIPDLQYDLGLLADRTKVVYTTKQNRSNYEGYIILEYTKTTD